MKHLKPFKEAITAPEIDVEDLEDIDISDLLNKKLIVYNDDHNTFEHVIETFMTVLKHDVEQAEQCAWIIHSKGKCAVKEGSYDELSKYKTALTDAGLKATIE